jgi:dCTP deaminase
VEESRREGDAHDSALATPQERGSIRLQRVCEREPDEGRADPDGIVTLRPGTFYLADLRQYTKLPPDIAMHIEGKSSLARLGVCVHITAPHAHAGWSGHLTLEILNSGPFNIELKPGIAMGQLTFWRVEQPLAESDLPTQQFSNQQTARG